MSKIPKYDYEKFTDLESQIFDKVKEIRQLICDNCPDVEYIDIAGFKHNGYIAVTANSNKRLPSGDLEDDIINCVVWDKEGIEDEQTDTDE